MTNDQDGSCGGVVELGGVVARASLATPLRGVTTAVPIGVIHKTIDADHPSRLHATMVAYGITYNCEQ